MTPFRFYYPIQVRFGDLDSQGHVNNAKYLTYLEQGRAAYLQQLGLWDGHSFLDLGIIIADVHIAYHAPIFYNQAVQVGTRVTRLGVKSLPFAYRLEDPQTGAVFASGETVAVAYDYRSNHSIPIPQAWRTTIREFEGLPLEDPQR